MKPPSFLPIPGWVATLDMAKDWATPPYKIEGGGRLLWYARYMVYREIKSRY